MTTLTSNLFGTQLILVTQHIDMLKLKVHIIFPQWLSGIGVALLMVQLGASAGCISPMMIKLMDPNSPIQLNSEEISWFASLVNIGRFLGALVSTIAIASLGTKRTIFISIMPIAIGWLGIALARDVKVLYAARVSIGIGLGMAISSFPLYLGEIAIPKLRGSLVSLAILGVPFGQLLGSTASNYLNLSESSFIYLAICLLVMAIFFFLPESPHHLIKCKKQEEARKSISWYKSEKGVDEELDSIEKFVASERNIAFMDRIHEFQNLGTRKATYQVIILFAFMQITGWNIITFYLETILRKARFNLIDPSEIVIYTNVCAIAASIISTFLIDKCGRKILLILSSAGLAVSLIMIASHFLLIDKTFDVTNLQWLPVVSVILYMFFFYVGMMSVPSTIMSEIIPVNVKCIVACIGSVTAGLFSFLSSKTYQPMIDLMGEAYVFFLYAVLSLILIPYTLFFVQETKGKSLQQIQDELLNK